MESINKKIQRIGALLFGILLGAGVFSIKRKLSADNEVKDVVNSLKRYSSRIEQPNSKNLLQRTIFASSSLAPDQQRQAISDLLTDKDLLIAQDILESDAAPMLPPDVLGQLMTRSVTDDEFRFVEWLTKVEQLQPEFFLKLTITPVSTFGIDNDCAHQIALLYAGLKNPSTQTKDKLFATLQSPFNRNSNLKLEPEVARRIGYLPKGTGSKSFLFEMGRHGNEFVASNLSNLDSNEQVAALAGMLCADATTTPQIFDKVDHGVFLKANALAAVRSAGITAQDCADRLFEYVSDQNSKDKGLNHELVEWISEGEVSPYEVFNLLAKKQINNGIDLLKLMAQDLAQVDPVAFSEQLGSFTNPPDYAIAALVAEIRADPEAAKAWALKIVDPLERERVLSSIPPVVTNVQ